MVDTSFLGSESDILFPSFNDLYSIEVYLFYRLYVNVRVLCAIDQMQSNNSKPIPYSIQYVTTNSNTIISIRRWYCSDRGNNPDGTPKLNERISIPWNPDRPPSGYGRGTLEKIFTHVGIVFDVTHQVAVIYKRKLSIPFQ